MTQDIDCIYQRHSNNASRHATRGSTEPDVAGMRFIASVVPTVVYFGITVNRNTHNVWDDRPLSGNRNTHNGWDDRGNDVP